MAESDVLAVIAALPTDADVQAAVAAALLVYDPPAATNYIRNPRFKDSDADGVPDFMEIQDTCGGTVRRSVVLNGDGSWYFEMEYTATVNDDTGFFSTIFFGTAGDFGPGDSGTLQIQYQLVSNHEEAVGEYSSITSENDAWDCGVGSRLDFTDTWAPIGATSAPLPVGTTRLNTFIKMELGAGIVVGDTITARYKCPALVKSPVPTPYFDGNYLNCAWAGPANASTSIRLSRAQVIAGLKAQIDAVKLKTDTLGGAGGITWTYTLTDPDGLPIAQALVWVTTDHGGNNVVASGITDDFGAVTFYLTAGTYYVWAKKAGTNFANPDTEVVA